MEERRVARCPPPPADADELGKQVGPEPAFACELTAERDVLEPRGPLPAPPWCADAADGAGEQEAAQIDESGAASAQALWRPAAKIASRYLAPYFGARDRAGEGDAQAALEAPRGFEDVEIAIAAPGVVTTPALRSP